MTPGGVGTADPNLPKLRGVGGQAHADARAASDETTCETPRLIAYGIRLNTSH